MAEPFIERFWRSWADRRRWPAGHIINAFHCLWYHSLHTWHENRFLGHRILQNPLDLQIYQELIWDKRPEAIVQTGIWEGGSLIYFASLMDLVGAPPDAPVIGVDIALKPETASVRHPRIHMIEGSSLDPSTLAQVRERLGARRPLVILDSDHSRDHVLAELDAYNELVAPGGSLVVEDTNVNGHPVAGSHGPGPFEAVQTFLARSDRFREDDRWRRNLLSMHHWLTRVR